MTQREEIVVRAGFDNTALASGLRSAKGMVQDVASSIGRTVMGFLSVGAIIGEVNSLVNKVMQIRNAAEITGQSAEGIQRLDYAFSQTGISVERGNNALERLNVKVGEAREGGVKAQEAFAKWGISIEGKDNAGIVAEIADRMLSMTDPAERAAMAVDLMGRSGKDLIPLLERGAVAMAALSAHAPIFSDDDMKNLEKFHSDIVDVTNRFQIWAGKGISWVAQAAELMGTFTGGGLWRESSYGSGNFTAPSKREIDAMVEKIHAAKSTASASVFLGPEYLPGTAETPEEEEKRNRILAERITLQDEMNQKTREKNLLLANLPYQKNQEITGGLMPSLAELAGDRFMKRLNRRYSDIGAGGPFGGVARELETRQHEIAWDVLHPGVSSQKDIDANKDRIGQLKKTLSDAGIIPAADKLDSIDARMQTLNESIDKLNATASTDGIVLKSN
jgi:hypothetical protein